MAKKLGLALGAGAAWGIASLGVLKVLEENSIKVDYLSGSSMGSLIAAAYASQFAGSNTIEKITQILVKKKLRHGFSLNRHHSFGLFSPEKLVFELEKEIGKLRFEDLKIPFTAVATDFNTGKEVDLKSGPLAPAVSASCAVAIMYTPVNINGQFLIDGGLSNPTPVNVLKNMGADILVGVDFTSRQVRALIQSQQTIGWHHKAIKFIPPLHYIINRNLKSSVIQVVDIFMHNLGQAKLAFCQPDILIEPEVHHLGIFTFQHAKEFIAIGEQEAKKILPKLKILLN